MIKRVFRPFWVYNVVAAEEWLARMASTGFLLQSVDFRKRVFVFEKGEPKKLIYQVDYNTEDREITPTLKKKAGEKSAGAGAGVSWPTKTQSPLSSLHAKESLREPAAC